jgi:CHAT domain-containing protein
MLAYMVTPQRLFVFSTTRQETRVQALPVTAAAVEAAVRLARQLLADPAADPDESSTVMGTLSQWLLAPLTVDPQRVRRLIVVPSSVLAYVPFGALKTPEGRFLVERYSVVYLPAASYLAEGAPASGQTGEPVRLTALAPLPDDLPATELEVRAVRQVRSGTRVLVGRRAGEAALRQALSSGSMTHVASHGVLNRVNPLFTRIELVPGRNGLPSDDGRLEVHEVLSLDIRSPLVFLSGCETGLGPGASQRYAPGEDYATLAAAFLTAGAARVVATLWAIADTGAAVFAARFYDELNRMDPADALAASQRAMLSNPRFRHPYYWAGYRLAGTGSSSRPAVMSVEEREPLRR